MSSVLSELAVPVVQAPMAGGPSTPALAAANRGGGLGFLAAGYLSTQRLGEDIEALLGLTDRPFGVNLFVGSGYAADPAQVQAHAQRLTADAQRAGVRLGEPHFDDDSFQDKLQLVRERAVAVVSFTFGLPPRQAVDELHGAGSEVWLT
jgi:nitronate monooxygenase